MAPAFEPGTLDLEVTVRLASSFDAAQGGQALRGAGDAGACGPLCFGAAQGQSVSRIGTDVMPIGVCSTFCSNSRGSMPSFYALRLAVVLWVFKYGAATLAVVLLLWLMLAQP